MALVLPTLEINGLELFIFQTQILLDKLAFPNTGLFHTLHKNH